MLTSGYVAIMGLVIGAVADWSVLAAFVVMGGVILLGAIATGAHAGTMNQDARSVSERDHVQAKER